MAGFNRMQEARIASLVACPDYPDLVEKLKQRLEGFRQTLTDSERVRDHPNIRRDEHRAACQRVLVCRERILEIEEALKRIGQVRA